MLKNKKRQDSLYVLRKIGEIVVARLKIVKSKQKLLDNKEFLEDEKYIRYILATTVSLESEDENRLELEWVRKRLLEREHELEPTRIHTAGDNKTETCYLGCTITVWAKKENQDDWRLNWKQKQHVKEKLRGKE
ncbi:hypothetical protein NPIL_322111 [Nephila pilipes]|uniref:Uncharacterized protein n=1 Tax=Nephila pilipes TaxID=299642 RepID=A0A8X6QBA0_NEPPI|nr:hypothetical protein NPIL_322111 [Nephila pilipes]